MNRSIKKGILVSVAAQAISMLCSFFLQLVVPKFISEVDYAQWQTFILYVNYVGILHFGLLDGIVLRYAQYDYDQLDKPRIRSQFIFLLCLTSFFAGITFLFSSAALGYPMQVVIIFVGVGIISKNVFTYSSYTFQITNRISKYAILVIAQKLFTLVLVAVFLINGKTSFYWFCLSDVLGDFLAILVGAYFNRGLYFGSVVKSSVFWDEVKLNISSGFLLLIANWTLNLLVGSAKLIIELSWGELVFGKVAFAFSVSNLFLAFISAISIVLFPSIKRMDESALPNLYKKIRDLLSPFLFVCLLFYFPGCWILEQWLPKYAESLRYLGMLFPIIVYSSKITLLTNNYLKAYRREKTMLIVNLFSIVFALIGYLLFSFVIKDIDFMILWIVLSMAVCSVLLEIAVMKVIRKSFSIDFLIEGLLSLSFISITSFLPLRTGMLAYCVALVLYLLLIHKKLIPLLKRRNSRIF